MVWKMIFVSIIFAFLGSLGVSEGYKILGLFPFCGHSHFVVPEGIMKTLARRGHTVHVLSQFPQEKPIQNYIDLSLRGVMEVPTNTFNIQQIKKIFLKDSLLNLLPMRFLEEFITSHEVLMNSTAMQGLLHSTEKYDLIITESFATDMTLGFVHKFKTPFIFVSASTLLPWTASLIGNPQNPSYIPNALSDNSCKMSFAERFYNTVSLAATIFYWNWRHVPKSERIVRKYFGADVPPLLDIAKNASLILANSHYSIIGARPNVPAVVEVAGIHVSDSKKLPEDIERFINDSPDGVIYFCMGSLIRSGSFSDTIKEAFLRAFSKIKQRVLWKFDDEKIISELGLTDKIMVKEWMPQRDILAHPKIKLFISHGGFMSITEAVHEGKPIIGIPLFGDQKVNIRVLEEGGMALYLDYDAISEETILQFISELLKPRYAENAKRISEAYHDRPMTPQESVVYWVEHVIRHKGNRRLRSAALDLPFYQYILADVVAVLSFIIIIFLLILFCVLKKLVVALSKKSERKGRKQKRH